MSIHEELRKRAAFEAAPLWKRWLSRSRLGRYVEIKSPTPYPDRPEERLIRVCAITADGREIEHQLLPANAKVVDWGFHLCGETIVATVVYDQGDRTEFPIGGVVEDGGRVGRGGPVYVDHDTAFEVHYGGRGVPSRGRHDADASGDGGEDQEGDRGGAMNVGVPTGDREIIFAGDGAAHLLPEGEDVTRCNRRAVLRGTKAPQGRRRCVECRDTLRPGAAPRGPRRTGRSWTLYTSILRAKLAERGLSLSRHRWRNNVGRGLHYEGKGGDRGGRRPIERHRPSRSRPSSRTLRRGSKRGRSR